MEQLAGRYRLDEPVGRGGMAVVWRAHDQVLGRTVAVKILSAHLSIDSRSCQRMRTEALSAARLSHPHLAGVYDYGEATVDGRQTPYLVLEYVDGPTLAARLQDDGALDWRSAVRICAEVAEALAAAHARGLVHRDIKPGNVMLPPRGVKVVDFGVALPIGRDPADTVGQVWGTPAYLAPEQVDGGQAVPAGDVYALGLLIAECLTGRSPWAATSDVGVLARRARTPVPSLPSVPGMPGSVVALYRQCLSDAPEDRPTAAQAAAALRQAARAAGPMRSGTATRAWLPSAWRPATAASPRWRDRARRSRRAIAVACAPVAAAAGLFAGQIYGADSPGTAAQGTPDQLGDDVAEIGCTARYTSHRNPDGTFTADLAVTNLGGQDLWDWSLMFDVPDGHAVDAARNARWSQQDRTVVLSFDRDLPAGATVQLSLRGAFDPVGTGVPTGFAVDGVVCERAVTHVRLSAAPPDTNGSASSDRSGGIGGSDRGSTDDRPRVISPPTDAAPTSPPHTSSPATSSSPPSSPAPTTSGPPDGDQSPTPSSPPPDAEPSASATPSATTTAAPADPTPSEEPAGTGDLKEPPAGPTASGTVEEA